MFIPRALESRSAVALLDSEISAKEFSAMRKLGFKCQCCGFICKPTHDVMSGGMEFVKVHDQWYLLCLMCAQSQHLTRPVLSEHNVECFNHGQLVFCPDIPQGKVINIVRDIYSLQLHLEKKRNRPLLEHSIRLRQDFIGSLIDSCNGLPKLKIERNDLIGYANLYRYAPSSLIANEEEVFGGVRYIPDEAHFSHIVSFWMSSKTL